MNEALQKVVAAVNDENPEKIWAGIPREKRELLPNEICKLLMEQTTFRFNKQSCCSK